MLSRWYDLKPQALALRKKGKSIREVESILKIPRSTLSGWFKNIQLTKKQTELLKEKNINSLNKARLVAAKWHMQQKEKRIELSKDEAINTLKKVDLKNRHIQELALAMLYLGEGGKTQDTCLGNSNPLIVNFFINSVIRLFNYNKNDLKCELHLRSDQDSPNMIKYWAKITGIQIDNFKVYKDKRKAKHTTYSDYKGVCLVRCGNVALQRKILYLSYEYCKRISGTVSSAG